MIRFLTYNAFLVFLLFSCRSYQYVDAVGVRPENAKEVNTFFLDTTESMVYRAKIDAFSRQINGTVLIKTIAPKEHRVAMVSNFGQTLFDVSIFADSYESHYIAPDLAKKSVVKTMTDIFRTVTEHRFANSALIFTDKQHYPVYIAGDSYYKFKENRVDNIIQVKGSKEQFVIDFTSESDSIPLQIDVQHKKYPLKMNLIFDHQS